MLKKIFGILAAVILSAVTVISLMREGGAIKTMADMSVPLPVLMYHSVVDDESLSGMYIAEVG